MFIYSISIDVFTKDKDKVTNFLESAAIEFDANPRADNAKELKALEDAGLPGWSLDLYNTYSNLTLETLKKLEELIG